MTTRTETTTPVFSITAFKRIATLAILGVMLGTSACSNMNSTEQRTLSGGAIGATVGTVGTLATGGCVACGAAIGGAVGAGAGYVYDKMKKD